MPQDRECRVSCLLGLGPRVLQIQRQNSPNSLFHMGSKVNSSLSPEALPAQLKIFLSPPKSPDFPRKPPAGSLRPRSAIARVRSVYACRLDLQEAQRAAAPPKRPQTAPLARTNTAPSLGMTQ